MRTPTLLLPDTTFRAAAVFPPTIVPETAFRPMPSLVFPRSKVPAASRPMKLPWIVLPLEPLVTLIPIPVFPK